MRKIPLLFEICFIKIFKNSCAYEINNTLYKMFGDIPVATLKINYRKIRPRLPYLLEEKIFVRNPENEAEYFYKMENYYNFNDPDSDDPFYNNTIEYSNDGDEEFSTEEIEFIDEETE